MRYFGSKATTCEEVLELARRLVPTGSFCDPFGGIGTMGSYFKRNGYEVWSGDHLRNAYNFQVAKIECDRVPRFTRLKSALGLANTEQILSLLNKSRMKDSWFQREYSDRRQFFTPENARRIAGAKRLIDRWTGMGLLSQKEESVLVSSLVESMDKVANTAGTYYAYLKTWYRKSLRPFSFEFIAPVKSERRCYAFHGEANLLVQKRAFDILYLDPPYNERCYGSYYHLPETLASHDEPFVVGKSGMPTERLSPRSLLTRKSEAANAFESLVASAHFRFLLVQYSDEGLITRTRLRSILRKFGSLSEKQLKAKGYTTTSRPRIDIHRLYIVSND